MKRSEEFASNPAKHFSSSQLQDRKKNKNAKEQKMKESERNFKNRQLQNKEYISFLGYHLFITNRCYRIKILKSSKTYGQIFFSFKTFF